MPLYQTVTFILWNLSNNKESQIVLIFYIILNIYIHNSSNKDHCPVLYLHIAPFKVSHFTAVGIFQLHPLTAFKNLNCITKTQIILIAIFQISLQITKDFQHLPASNTISNISINSTFNSENVCLTPTEAFYWF